MTPHPKTNLKIRPKSNLRPGHPWLYRSQLEEPREPIEPGSLIELHGSGGRFLGRGYYNPKSEITVRLLTQKDEVINTDFFKKKLKQAIDYRKSFVKDTNAFRLVSSEADGLPGLIIDRYNEILVVQFLTLGMERLRGPVLEALEVLVPSRGIYERSDSSSRSIEGLEPKIGWIRKDCGDETIIVEKNIQYKIHFGEGQKTGFYLDQRENRIFLGELHVQGEALDAFCYSGGFGLHLAANGSKVFGIDSQSEAITQGKENRTLNNIDPALLEFEQANVFDALKRFEKEKRKYNLVILDPPSFVKRKEALEGALSGYKEILLRSMKILHEEGLLAVFSCSHHIDDNLLMQASMSAAWDVRRTLKVIKFFKQSSDHPINPFIPETYYLKGFLFSVSSV
ncbi:MAG: hypothetical protein AUJ72_00405 [Candidatus Omnitrophica bacterium CG1_02_46_14]|nr:MAG: hypothetical protein AUJ72_00405 [Candidatus Omnitrophica bacterium CG1_02_46_14]